MMNSDHLGDIKPNEGKVGQDKQTPEWARDNTRSQRNQYNIKGMTGMGESQKSLVDTEDNKPPRECWGVRHTLGLMGLLGTASVYSMRVNLSVAIVAMVKSGSKNITNSSDVSQVCLPPDGYDPNDKGNEEGEFDWDEATQGQILGVFFYGYTITNLIGGRAAEIFGGKIVFGWGVVLTGIFTLLSPLCVRFSTGLFMAIRVLEGLSEGVMFPAMNCLLAKWIPPDERAKFVSLVFAGSQLGTVVSMPVSGWLCDTDFLGGWPSVFYVFGTLGIIWGIPWYFLVYSTPDLHPRMSVAEKTYISRNCANSNTKAIAIPWRAIFTSIPFWSLLVVHVGSNWGFYTLLTELPTYLDKIQHFDMTSNGILSALPYLLMWLFSMVYSILMSHLQSTGKLSAISIRRMSTAIGMYGPMVAIVAMCFVGCNQVLAMVVICLAVGLSGSSFSGFSCSHQDMSPNLAGTLLGFTNAAANIPGFLAPTLIGLITNENQTLSAWRTVFLISAVIYMVTATFYVIFVSTEIQPWNFPKDKNDGESGHGKDVQCDKEGT